MHEPPREYIFSHRTFACDGGQKRAHLCLHIGRKTGKRLGLEIQWFAHTVRTDRNRAVLFMQNESAIAQSIGDRGQMIGANAVYSHFLAGDRPCDQERVVTLMRI